MLEAIENKESHFTHLSLTLHDYINSQTRPGEISLKGKLYDIKSVQVSGNKVELMVMNDVNEEKIIEKINQLEKHSKEPGNSIPNKLMKFFSLLYLCPHPAQLFSSPASLTLRGKLNIHFISFIQEITAPPPWLS